MAKTQPMLHEMMSQDFPAYVFQPYPKMLYKDITDQKSGVLVKSAEEEVAQRKEWGERNPVPVLTSGHVAVAEENATLKARVAELEAKAGPENSSMAELIARARAKAKQAPGVTKKPAFSPGR